MKKLKNLFFLSLLALLFPHSSIHPMYSYTISNYRKTEKTPVETALFKNLPTIETERLIIQPIMPNHDQDLFKVLSDKSVMRYTPFIKTHHTIQDTQEYIKKILKKYSAEKPAPWAIIHKKDNVLIGYCGFKKVSKIGTAVVIYGLKKEYLSQGLTVEALKKVIECGFTRFHFNRIETYGIDDCSRRITASKDAGMRYEGTLKEVIYGKGGYWDARLYAITNSQWEALSYR